MSVGVGLEHRCNTARFSSNLLARRTNTSDRCASRSTNFESSRIKSRKKNEMMLAHLKSRKYTEKFVLKPLCIRDGTMHFNHPRDKTFAARPHERSSFLAIDGIQSRKPSSLAGIQPLFSSSSFFFLFFFLLLFPFSLSLLSFNVAGPRETRLLSSK